MTKNKKPALATRAVRNERRQANVSARYSMSRFFLRQLAKRATQNAQRCERRATKRQFERIARFLEVCARGGVR